MLIKQVKELNQVTIIYNETDKDYQDLVLQILKKEHYCFKFDKNTYQFRKKKQGYIPKVKKYQREIN